MKEKPRHPYRGIRGMDEKNMGSMFCRFSCFNGNFASSHAGGSGDNAMQI
jgi:hypothetical protein